MSAPYRAAISAGSGSTWCWHALQHTISRTLAAAASVIGGPGSNFLTLVNLRYLPTLFLLVGSKPA
jgi:hypothetical protein